MPETTKYAFQTPNFTTIDYGVVVVYLLAMLWYGWRIGSRVKSTSSFFVAGGRLSPLVVGLSLLGTYLSALTMMGLTGNSFRDTFFAPDLDRVWNWMYAVQLPFLIVTAFIMTRIVLPRYRAAKVVSVYEFLEQRIHVSCRLLATVCFLALAMGRMALVLYLPALGLNTVAGLDLTTTIIAMGLIVTLYTVIGGIEAAIWTDVVQVVILVAGAIVGLVYVLILDSGGAGLGGLIQTASEHGKFQMFDLTLDWKQPVTAWFILETLFQTVRIFGTQQDMTQRYMTTDTTEEANKSVWISILGYIPLGFLFFFMGTALFVFYVRNFDPNVYALGQAGKWDAIYPYFVVSALPVGIAGLVISAILAAAMSSLSSLLNSASTVCVEDFFKRFARVEKTDLWNLKTARLLTVALGIMGTFAALALIGNTDAQKTWTTIMAYSTNGVLALMAVAFMPIKMRPAPAIIGFVIGGAALYTVQKLGAVNFLLYTVVGNLTAFIAMLVINAIVGLTEGKSDEAPATT